MPPLASDVTKTTSTISSGVTKNTPPSPLTSLLASGVTSHASDVAKTTPIVIKNTAYFTLKPFLQHTHPISLLKTVFTILNIHTNSVLTI